MITSVRRTDHIWLQTRTGSLRARSGCCGWSQCPVSSRAWRSCPCTRTAVCRPRSRSRCWEIAAVSSAKHRCGSWSSCRGIGISWSGSQSDSRRTVAPVSGTHPLRSVPSVSPSSVQSSGHLFPPLANPYSKLRRTASRHSFWLHLSCGLGCPGSGSGILRLRCLSVLWLGRGSSVLDDLPICSVRIICKEHSHGDQKHRCPSMV